MTSDTNVDDRYALSILFDVVPQFSWVFKPAATTVSNAYKSILDYKEVPESTLSAKQKADLDAAYTTYDTGYAAYETAMNAYLPVLDEYDEAVATQENGGKKVPSSLKAKLKVKYDAWLGAGKLKVEGAVATIAQYEALEPTSFWYKLDERYKTGTESALTGNDFQRVGFSPPLQGVVRPEQRRVVRLHLRPDRHGQPEEVRGDRGPRQSGRNLRDFQGVGRRAVRAGLQLR